MPIINETPREETRFGWVDDWNRLMQDEGVDYFRLIEAGARLDGQRIIITDEIATRALEQRRERRDREEPRNEPELLRDVDSSWMDTSDYDEDNDEPESELVTMSMDEDYDADETPRKWVDARDFPDHDLPEWSSNEISEALDRYFKHVEYRLRWIFNREEREGFRRRNVSPFCPDDFHAKVEKAPRKHQLSNETSTFYDWNFGSTDFILRLERFLLEEQECLRCHFVYKPNDKQLGYEDRVWNGQNYRAVNIKWAGG